jgi:dynein intermediate chain 2, axonemal
MNDYLQYPKKLRDYDNPCEFENIKSVLVGWQPQEGVDKERGFQITQEEPKHVERNPNFIQLDNIPTYSESTVNTERISINEKGIIHKEGAWPAGVDPTERQDLKKFIKKKIERTPDNVDKFTPAVKKLVEISETVISNNNIIDMYEEYFAGEEPDHVVESLSTKTLMLFK